MLKVQLYFTLVGKSSMWERGLSKETIDKATNEDRLDIVRDIVSAQFGDRKITIMNEQRLKIKGLPYPGFYSAGWFVSQGDDALELVVVDHGKTMEAATKAMLESVKTIDWSKHSKKVEV